VFLERIIRDLNEHVQGCVAELVFNLDEVDISEWEDRTLRKVAVPATMDGQTMHHAVSWNVKHISLIACVWAAGESLALYIAISENPSPVQGLVKNRKSENVGTFRI
jgi:hypothetical protein